MTPNTTYLLEKNINDFVDKLDEDQKKSDTLLLIDLMLSVIKTGPTIYESGIIGFGKYYYKYASGHEGEAPLIGFSPRKNAISLYIYTGNEEHNYLLDKLGKFTMGKACIYVKKLSDIDLNVAKELMRKTVSYLSEKYTRIN